ncbi:arsenite efflux transporter metallochaperone ArsD [Prosthecobacter sp.]|uniref:arsenite efflux transporter metallochaperone ArsD n=1 Tax=Prosthecobacter sp. TaxID=1965333 RepID=UPI001D5710E7|nr:arsenite efflux transporter metallochaperone ArsD [Prosthecobacter sp.]MCB1277218.1 arsenite efflux transporter metallochaperone ArsD [Prosthecobacter sp.]
MKTIQVYDPAMCCSTGICGPSVDPDLVNFAAMLSQLKGMGVHVERFNLAQQPMAFATNACVKEILAKEGTAALPISFWDGEVHLKGRYPTHDERPGWFQAAIEKKEAAV